MRKSTFTPLYEAFRAKLVAMRTTSHLSQRELAKRLGRERSFVSRIELGERRLDLVEFYWVCEACGQDPTRTAAEIMRSFGKIEAKESRAGVTAKRR
jgi:transcriptional regulator with XRE-family HTH domain